MFPSTRAITLAVLSTTALRAYAADASVLKPPVGAKAAIVVFEDLESPESASAYPVMLEAANTHKIPVLRYDFPLPRHSWSFTAAVWARYFESQDSKSAKLGNEFRRFIYASQKQISRDNLQQWVQKFADEHKIVLPSDSDPAGKLAEKVKADFALGQRIGVEHPPTIWVISNSGVSQPAVEEITSDQLNQMIDDVLRKVQTAKARNPAPRKSALNQQKRSIQGVIR
ncbi:MAG TPA: hypothetical protein VIB39_14245 [Candidatus Angelobacter sp.]|jgi:hypothetical protein